MKLPCSSRFTRFLLFVSALFTVGATAQAQKLSVTYNPPSTGIGGELPYYSSHEVIIKAPSGLPVGSSFPLTSTLTAQATSIPNPEVSAAVAASWVTFSQPTVTFTAANQQVAVQVIVDIPASALSGAVPSGTYTFLVHAAGWPAGVANAGHRIDASVAAASEENPGEPPVIEIQNPIPGTVTYSANEFPAEVPFDFIATVRDVDPVITRVTSVLTTESGDQSLTTTNVGLETRRVTGSGTFTVTGPGLYTITSRAFNEVGEDVDAVDYFVVVRGELPTVTIHTPAPGTSYEYRWGSAPVQVPVTFTARSLSDVVRTVTAKLDGEEIPVTVTGGGTAVATGSVTLPYTTAGEHTFEVAMTDAYGAAVDATNFIITVVKPTPVISILTPAEGDVFTVPVGSTTTAVAYTFTTSVDNGFVITAAGASLGSTPLSPLLSPLGVPVVNGSGVMNLAPGTYQLNAQGESNGIVVTDTVTFTVRAAATPPTVTIDSPPNGYTLEIAQGATATIPFQFTGRSTTTGAVITALTATLDGSPIAYATSGLDSPVAVGTATLTFTTAGSHVLAVTATDAHGKADTVGTFTITVAPPKVISGHVFFDVNANGTKEGADYGLAGVTVKLYTAANTLVATKISDASGNYSFPAQYPGDFKVVASAASGFSATTPTTRAITLGTTNTAVPDIGYRLDLCAIKGMKANGFTIGYWKNNVDKAIQGKSKGAQVNAATINAYTDAIAAFALAPYNGLTKQQASATMGSTSSVPADLLRKQLLGSEYNYQNKAYLNGDGVLTYAFVYWGEYVLQNSGNYSGTYLIEVKDWFDAYNNTHGGVVGGPN